MENIIEMWEQEIEESSKPRTFEILETGMSMLNESISLDMKLVNEDIVTEGVKEFFATVIEKLDKYIGMFKEFIKGIISKIKNFFSSKVKTEAQKNRVEFAKNNDIESEKLAEAHKEVKEYIEGLDGGALVSIKINEVKNASADAKKDFQNIDNWVNSVKQKDIDTLRSDLEQLKADIQDQVNQDDKAVDYIIQRFFAVIDDSTFGNNITEIINNINKLESNIYNGGELLTEYANILGTASESIKVKAIAETFKSKVDKNLGKENEYGKLLSSYVTYMVSFLANQKTIITAFTKEVVAQKKAINHIYDIYKNAASSSSKQ